MNAALRLPDEPSPTRDRLCNRANAERVAARLFDASGRNVAIVRTTNPLQPFRVLPSCEAEGEQVEVELVR
jgi:hypothetical protein